MKWLKLKKQINIKNRIRQGVTISKQQVTHLGTLAFAWFFVFGVDVAYGAASGLLGLFLMAMVPGIILAATGFLMDMSIGTLVVKPAAILGNMGDPSSIMYALQTIWTIIRDLSNIIIIGIFVYIAINKILSREGNFNNMIVRLLSAAILINFSFFFALSIFDISNWLSVTVYNQIVVDNTFSFSEYFLTNLGMGSLMQIWGQMVTSSGALAIQTNAIAGGDVISQTVGWGAAIIGSLAGNPIGNLIYILITTILFLILSILFLRVTFILVSRFIIILILLVTSGAAFTAMLVPGLNKYWKMWYTSLLYNSVVAPILLLMLWSVSLITLALNKTGLKNTLTESNSEWFTGAKNIMDIVNGKSPQVLNEISIYFENAVSSILNMIIVIGLLWAAIRIATMLSNKAADSAGGLGRGVSKLLGGMQSWGANRALRGGSLVGMHTLGAGFQTMQSGANIKAMKYEGKSGWRNAALGKMARMRAGLYGKGAGASYHGGNSKFLRDQAKHAGIGLKEGPSGGIVKELQRQAEAKKGKDKADDAANRDAFAKEVREAGINQSEADMNKESRDIDKLITASEKHEKELTDTVSQMASHNNGLDTKEGAKVALKETQNRVEQLSKSREEAMATGDSGLAAKMAKERDAQDEKITKIKDLIQAETAFENSTQYADAQSNYQANLATIDASQLSKPDKDASKQRAKTQLKTKLSNLRQTSTSMARSAAKNAHTSISQTLVADNVTAQIAQTHNEQKELNAQKTSIEQDLSTYKTIKKRANERSEDLGLNSVGEKNAQSVEERMEIIQRSDELDKTITDLNSSIQDMTIDIKRAIADGDSTKVATLEKQIEIAEKHVKDVSDERKDLQKTVISQRDKMDKRLKELRIERYTLEKRLRDRNIRPQERKHAEKELLKIQPLILDLSETLKELRKRTKTSKEEYKKTVEELREEAEKGSKKGKQEAMMKDLMKAFKKIAEES